MTVPAYDDLVLRLRAAGCVFAEEEADVLLDTATGDALEALVTRRLAGEPLEHLVGWVDFAGVRVGLDPGVFIPRQRSAVLVDVAEGALVSRLASLAPQPAAAVVSLAPQPAAAVVSLAPQPAAAVVSLAPQPAAAVVVDVCCGSGALGLVLARRHPGIELHAADADPAAVACARRNLTPVGGTVHHGDLVAPLPRRLRGRVDVLVANVPYVPTAAVALMPPESREHEPRSTVDGGADGLDVVRRLAALAPAWLAPGGTVLVETSFGQAESAATAMARAGLVPRVHHDAEHDATVVAGSPRGAGDE